MEDNSNGGGVHCAEELGRKLRILVVEDDRGMAELLDSGMHKRCSDVDVRYTGEAALDAVAVREYDAVLLDIVLPDMLGLEVLRTIRAGAAMGDPAVVMMTAAGEEYAMDALNDGADGYVTKPFVFEELSAVVWDRVSQRRQTFSHCNVAVRLYRVERALTIAVRTMGEANGKASAIVESGKANGKALDEYLEGKQNAI